MNKPLPSFEQLRELAEKDPDALERLRQEHVDELISNAPEEFQQRLRGLQFQIDGQVRIAKTPMAACLKISNMMHDSLHNMKDYIEGVQNDAEPTPAYEPARVLSFKDQA